MAIVHQTTLTPSKLELLEAWLPTRRWYRGTTPRLSKAGGFRLDDPDGVVGIEFLLLIDDSATGPQLYHVPLTYRGAPLHGADEALVGTMEHGVLGRRWAYDATRDPVAVNAVVDLLAGRATAQAQNYSDTVDSAVQVRRVDVPDNSVQPIDTDTHTDLPVSSDLTLRIHRLPVDPLPDAVGAVAAPYVLADVRRSVVEVVSVRTRATAPEENQV
ncbi:1,4-alpha-glucan branching protein [Nocardia sp. NPDC023988]|uniref:maltokinase N-terminal cap-like domain-containing protein n=1 Tax=unclassified Nocardia TaxID=2637762 RepID=UPI0034048835